MAKKDNFDFETEGKPKLSLNLGSLKDLTKQQKGIIVAAVVVIVLAVAFIVAFLIIGANSDNSGNTNNPSGSQNGSQSGESDDGDGDGENNNGSSSDDDSSYEILSMNVASAPTKTVYYVGEYADYSGLVLILEVNTEEAEDYIFYDSAPDKFKFSGFDSLAPVENQDITVEYEGFTATFEVKIVEIPKTPASLKSIRLDPNNMPTETCKYGYAPDVRGAKLICEYTDGTTKVIDLAYNFLNNFEDDLMAAQIGDTVTIEVIYDEGGYVATTSFTITITE